MFARSLSQRPSNHNYSLFTQRVFTQDWPNSYWITVSYSVLPVLQSTQSGECTWRRMFLPREITKNVNKLLALLLLHVFSRFFYTTTKCSLLPNFLLVFSTVVVAKNISVYTLIMSIMFVSRTLVCYKVRQILFFWKKL